MYFNLKTALNRKKFRVYLPYFVSKPVISGKFLQVITVGRGLNKQALLFVNGLSVKI